MSGISGDLLRSLRKTLAECKEFRDENLLAAVFLHELLDPWRDEVPLGIHSIPARVDTFLITFRYKRRADTRASVLVLFLLVLRERYEPEDEMYDRLGKLAEQLGRALPANPTAVRPHIQEEANPGNQQMLFTAGWLNLLHSLQAVGKITVPQIRYGEPTLRFPGGTGWLLAPGLALTCFHVIKARGPMEGRLYDADLQAQVRNSVLMFDFLFPGKGVEYRIAGLECYDTDLDYVLLSLEDRVDHPLSARGFLGLEPEVPLTLQTNLYIIQHPKGQPQQYSSGRFIQYKPEQVQRILHSAPTEEGTSGGPVINVANWQVVALHNGENEAFQLREATLLKPILASIQQKRPDLHNRILNVH